MSMMGCRWGGFSSNLLGCGGIARNRRSRLAPGRVSGGGNLPLHEALSLFGGGQLMPAVMGHAFLSLHRGL